MARVKSSAVNVLSAQDGITILNSVNGLFALGTEGQVTANEL